MGPLPAPGTRTEQFLAAVVDEVAGLRADLAARGGDTPAVSGSVELREPRTRLEPLPDPVAKPVRKAAAKKATGRRRS